MNHPRVGHTATTLQDGRVLVAGGRSTRVQTSSGYGSVYSTPVEIYDPDFNIWTVIGQMKYPRHGPTATLLNNGQVLIVGGSTQFVYVDSDGFKRIKSEITHTAEVIDPEANQIYEVNALSTPRIYHDSILLKDGRVLVIGSDEAGGVAEVFDPTTGEWTSMQLKCGGHANFYGGRSATLLPNGTVLWLGHGNLYSTEGVHVNQTFCRRNGLVIDVKSGESRNFGYDSGVKSTGSNLLLLHNDNLLFIASSNLVEFNPMDAEAPQAIIDFNRRGAPLVQLDDGRVLLVGGQATRDNMLPGSSATWVYHPLIKTSPAASKPVATPTATARIAIVRLRI